MTWRKMVFFRKPARGRAPRIRYDLFFADPAAVEDDYRRMRREG
jgi:hypothetical protein